MPEIHDIKIIAATFILVGIVSGFINQKLAPDYIELMSSRKRPKWLPWLSWAVTAFASVLYVVIDFIK